MALDKDGKRWQAPYDDMRDYMELLDKNGLLHRITAPVELKHEIGAIASRSLNEAGPSLLFENIKDHPGQKLVANLIGSPKQLGVAFGTEPKEPKIYEAVVFGMQNRISSVEKSTGAVKEVIHTGDAVNLYDIPTPWWHEEDGGQYIATTAGCVTRHPDTGQHNMGLYRCMVKSKDSMSWSGGAGDLSGSGHIRAYHAQGQPAPVALAIGMDPLLTLAAGTPVPADEEGMAEFEAAAGWRGRSTELVKCETSDLMVPANAEYIVEGVIMPADGQGERTNEGPHGESVGYYGANENCYLMRVTAITHRKDPINYGLICQLIEDYPRSLLRSGSFQTLLARRRPDLPIKECYFPEVGRLGMMIVRADVTGPGDAREIMNAVWDNQPWRWVIVVDEDCDVRDWNDVMWRVVSCADPDKDQVVLGKLLRQDNPAPQDEWDYIPPARGMGIDATMKQKPDQFFPLVNRVSNDLRAQVAARWSEFGFK